jgi:uncharacterized protein (DUF488 family)
LTGLYIAEIAKRTMEKKKIWTIGHSTRALDDFLNLLRTFNIGHLVDVRTFPGSKRFPHFNKESLAESLDQNNILYSHMVELGGRRKPHPQSVNSSWRHPSFRGYADYMQTPSFEKAIEKLEAIGLETPVAYMCSEAVWWKCHRALISDYLKVRGWTVLHILDLNKITEHPFTAPAKTAQGKLFY